jgi:hypothetical protein
MRYLRGAVAFAVLLVSCAVAQVNLQQNEIERGGQWLLWSSGQRITYVRGFITGYQRGFHRACELADELFEVGKKHRLGDEEHPSQLPSARCLARMETYSKVSYAEALEGDFTAYTSVITEFYSHHPEYRGIPFMNIMKLLGDSSFKTADQLYQMALKGEIRPVN